MIEKALLNQKNIVGNDKHCKKIHKGIKMTKLVCWSETPLLLTAGSWIEWIEHRLAVIIFYNLKPHSSPGDDVCDMFGDT